MFSRLKLPYSFSFLHSNPVVLSATKTSSLLSDAENGRILALFVADAFTSSSSVSLSDRADGIVDFSSVKASLEQSANWREIVPPNSGLVSEHALCVRLLGGLCLKVDGKYAGANRLHIWIESRYILWLQ